MDAMKRSRRGSGATAPRRRRARRAPRLQVLGARVVLGQHTPLTGSRTGRKVVPSVRSVCAFGRIVSSGWTSARARDARARARGTALEDEKVCESHARPGRRLASASASSAAIGRNVTSVLAPLESCATQTVTRFVAPPSLSRRPRLAAARASTTRPEKQGARPEDSAAARRSAAETSPNESFGSQTSRAAFAFAFAFRAQQGVTQSLTETLLKLARLGVSGAFPKRPELPYEAWVRLASASAAALTNDALCSSAHASTARARAIRVSCLSSGRRFVRRRTRRRFGARNAATPNARGSRAPPRAGLASPSRESS